MQALTISEVETVNGALSSDTIYGAALGVAVGLLAIGATVGTGGLAGFFILGSYAASGVAIYESQQ
jgi:hypothetical protein